MHGWVLPPVDWAPFDTMMYDERKNLRILPAARILEFPKEVIQTWCVLRGVYQIPTQELIDWLKEQIGSRSAIEICAGNGSIGRALNIPRTDSYVQTLPEMVAYYKMLGQEPITPPADVIKYDANEAVEVLKPTVVVGAYVTQKYQDGNTEGSVVGVDEHKLLENVYTYIHIGNDGPHGSKRINKLKHAFYRFPWLITRAKEPNMNHIRVWSRSGVVS